MKIAVCDDEKVFRDTISAYLKPFIENSPEITQTAFSCGEDLIAAYEQGNRFDLIFLDVEMAGMSMTASAPPSFMMAPLPNCFSICVMASSIAF